MYGPILKGATTNGRPVTLRPPTENDASMLIDWLADLEVTSNLTRVFPMSLGSEIRWLNNEADNPESVIWIIEYKPEDHFLPVGITGIHQISAIHRHATTGTFIGVKRFWRQGIATEAMRLRTDFAFERLNLHKLSSSFLDGNTGSYKAQKASDYKIVGRKEEEFWSKGGWVSEVLTEVLRSDWEATRKPKAT